MWYTNINFVEGKDVYNWEFYIHL